MLYFFLFIVLPPHQQDVIIDMRNSPVEELNKLADISISMDNDFYYYDPTLPFVENRVFRKETHAYADTNERIIYIWFLLHHEEKYETLWYRSTETVMSEYPHLNWLSKKKWPLNEELNLHMLNYQEVQSL